MNSVALGGIVFVCLFGGALIGISLRARLPEHHLSSDSKDAIRLATAIVGTLSALALGLLVASAKTSRDAAEAEMRTSAGHIVLLDRVMAHYGEATKNARVSLRKFLEERLDHGWLENDAPSVNTGLEEVQDLLRALTPNTNAERWLQSQALDVSGKIAEAEWLFVASGEEVLPWAFLVVVVFWLAVIFGTFGLLAPSNPTVVATLLVCSLSVAGAVFLIVDMANPYRGVIYISDSPLRSSLRQLGPPE